jgi:DNA-binding Lrp family transcriptional regulator
LKIVPNIDSIDEQILEHLQRDARLSNKAIAEAVGIAPSTCLERIRSLVERRVITGFHAEVDFDALNRSIQAMVSVRLLPKTKETIDRFYDHVWNLPETVAVYLQSGSDDLLIHLAVANTSHLRELVIDKIASFPGVIDERTSLVFEHRRKTALHSIR